MKLKRLIMVFGILLFVTLMGYAQNVTLFNQLNGKIDFKMIGNTLNPIENSLQTSPEILSSSSASLTLNPSDIVKKAYLYWAGSGTGDFDVTLNTQSFTADRRFSHRVNYPNQSFDYFSAFKDITTYIQTTGIGNYTFSNLDNSTFLNSHFSITTNFAGWAILIVYENPSLSVNQINVYDGLQGVPNDVSISLNSLNIIDNLDSKIGFISWEGDKELAVNETLRINSQILSNPPLNPANNAFNGTNSLLGTTTLYNMDLDVYPVQNNIQIGDQSALIQLTSSRDFVLINTIITKFNSRLPDATIAIDATVLPCNTKNLTIQYTVSNLDGIEELPAQTPIAIYANSILVAQTQTNSTIAIGASQNGSVSVILPATIPSVFVLKLVVDDIGDGTGIRSEINEINNENTTTVAAFKPPIINFLPNLISCNEGNKKGTFNFSGYEELVKTDIVHRAAFYESESNAITAQNPIPFLGDYIADTTPKKIYVRVDDADCFAISSFTLLTKNCPPTAIFNYITADGDSSNSSFEIEGLRDVFVNFRTEIYNRWGKLVWVGTNSIGDWDGLSNQPIRLDINSKVTTDTYFYIVNLNDPDFPEPLVGYIYLYKKKM